MKVIFFLIAAYNFIDSPKEKILKREIENYKIQTALFNEKTEKLSGVLKELQERDASIYRSVFEAEPISSTVRQGGFGGVEKYRELEGYENSDVLINLNKKLDQLNKQLYVVIVKLYVVVALYVLFVQIHVTNNAKVN